MKNAFIPEQESEIIEMMVTPENLSQLTGMNNRRQIRNAGVAKLHGYLIAGDNFKAPLHVTKENGKYVVIDGNHRLEAIQRYLAIPNSDRQVRLRLIVYKSLTPEQQIKLYDVLATTVNQTLNDFIKIHFKEIALFGMIEKEFPIDVQLYSTQNALLYSNLARCYCNKESEQYLVKNKNTIYEQAILWGLKDYTELTYFFRQYKNAFGNPSAATPYYRTGVLYLIMSLWFRNKAVIDAEDFWVLIKSRLFNHVQILELAKYSASAVMIDDYRHSILDQLNRKWHGTKLV